MGIFGKVDSHENHYLLPPNSTSARAPPQTPLEELTALPRLLAGFKGLLLKGGMRGEKGRSLLHESRGRDAPDS